MTDTTFLWDASHYDDPPSYRDGVDGYTHKLTDGDHFYEDAEYGQAMGMAVSLGFPILGPYHVLHGKRSIANQADWLLARTNALTPWWREHECWVWQVDAEPFGYLTAPTIAEINAFGDAVCARANCPSQRFLVYAPQWHYGTALTGLQYRWWSSKYGANPTGWYRSVYPGNESSRWSGPVDPLLLQYGSNTTIAGQTTCDANAYRGTLDQLRAALRATTDQKGLSDMLFLGKSADSPEVYVGDGLAHRYVAGHELAPLQARISSAGGDATIHVLSSLDALWGELGRVDLDAQVQAIAATRTAAEAARTASVAAAAAAAACQSAVEALAAAGVDVAAIAGAARSGLLGALKSAADAAAAALPPG